MSPDLSLLPLRPTVGRSCRHRAHEAVGQPVAPSRGAGRAVARSGILFGQPVLCRISEKLRHDFPGLAMLGIDRLLHFCLGPSLARRNASSSGVAAV